MTTFCTAFYESYLSKLGGDFLTEGGGVILIDSHRKGEVFLSYPGMVISNERWFITWLWFYNQVFGGGERVNNKRDWGEGYRRTDFNLTKKWWALSGEVRKKMYLLRGITSKTFTTVNVSKHMNSLVLHGKSSLNFWEKQRPRRCFISHTSVRRQRKNAGALLYTSAILLSTYSLVSGIFAFSTPAQALPLIFKNLYYVNIHIQLYYAFLFYR